jgi:hypothetical protein
VAIVPTARPKTMPQAEQQRDDRADALDQRGLDDRAVLAAQRGPLRGHDRGEQDGTAEQDPAGAAQAGPLGRGQAQPGDVVVGGVGVGVQVGPLGQDDPGDQRDHQREDDRGGDGEEPVADRGHHDRRVHDPGRGGGDAGEDRVVGGGDRAGVVAGGDRGVGDDDPEDRRAPDRPEREPAERHQDHVRRGRRDVRDGPGERDREHHQRRGHPGDAGAHGRGEQPTALGDRDTHDHRDDGGHRRELREVVDHRRDGHREAVAGEQVPHRDGLAVGCDDGDARRRQPGADHGEDRRQHPEQPERVWQRVPDPFDDGHRPHESGQLPVLGGGGGAHRGPPRPKKSPTRAVARTVCVVTPPPE